jgi:hypothetical protein
VRFYNRSISEADIAELYNNSPTVINLSSFTATPKAGKVIIQWNTETETDNGGFNIYRAESENGQYVKITTAMIPAKGSATQGASYEFIDTNVQNRKIYYYELEDIDLNGKSTMHDSVSAMPRWIYGGGGSKRRLKGDKYETQVFRFIYYPFTCSLYCLCI